MQTSIAKWGNSQGIRLSKALLESANISDTDTLDVTAHKNSIIITKVERKKTHIPLAVRIQNWESGHYELTDEDKQWLDMKPVREEKYRQK